MFLCIDKYKPEIAPGVFVAPNATLAGRVSLAGGASVWYGAVLRADTGAIRIGQGSNVQDNAVLHTGPALDVVLGARVSVGHCAVVHGCTVGSDTLIGMHATVMNGCRIGKGCIIAAGALVPENTVIPDGMLALGVPARVRGPVTPQQAAANAANAEEYCALAAQHAAALRSADAPRIKRL